MLSIVLSLHTHACCEHSKDAGISDTSWLDGARSWPHPVNAGQNLGDPCGCGDAQVRAQSRRWCVARRDFETARLNLHAHCSTGANEHANLHQCSNWEPPGPTKPLSAGSAHACTLYGWVKPQQQTSHLILLWQAKQDVSYTCRFHIAGVIGDGAG